MLATINSIGLSGIDGYKVKIEADVQDNFPAFEVVGLPDLAVKEAKERVKAAMYNNGYYFPDGKVTVNLAPASVKKEGSVFDLPIFLAVLKASGQLRAEFENNLFVGEISLSGELCQTKGILPTVILAKEFGYSSVFVPYQNRNEASVIEGISVYAVKNIVEIVKHLEQETVIEPLFYKPTLDDQLNDYPFDFSDVSGQKNAKRALEIAAAGGHNVLLIGPPGSGKSMLSKRLPTILPPLTMEEAIETTKIHSVAGLLSEENPFVSIRPFRSPHHTATTAALTGSGMKAKPGEIPLSHNGVLFLDELPEFQKNTLEILRQPLEDGKITISRALFSTTYPSSITLICAMNPCRCGYFGHPTRKCTCSKTGVSNYLQKVSGPLLDRLDLHVEVPSVTFDEINRSDNEESSAEIKKRVIAAREIQKERYKDSGINCNSKLGSNEIKEFCRLDDKSQKFLKDIFDKLSLSARSYDKIIKTSRTIADLAGEKDISYAHLAEALQYRSLDRKYWVR